jgi:DNA-binding response OmpR family regulator
MLTLKRASILLVTEPGRDTVPDRVLRSAGHDVHAPAHPEGTLRALFDVRPDLIVLDVDASAGGWDLLDRIHDCCSTPVLVISGGDPDLDLVRALRAGAADFVAKPARAAEILARGESLLRRSASAAIATRHEDDFLTIDFERCRVVVAGAPVHLTPLEFRLLTTLVRHAGQVLSRDQLLELVWGHSLGDGDEVRVYIRYLRRKLLAACGREPIETVRGFGYTYAPPPVTPIPA